MTFETLTVPADKLKVGDVLRFRMSKYDPVLWLPIKKLVPGKYRYEVICGEKGDHMTQVSIRNKSEWATVRRPVATEVGG
jgi:uncharacterized protein (DUF2249 family)